MGVKARVASVFEMGDQLFRLFQLGGHERLTGSAKQETECQTLEKANTSGRGQPSGRAPTPND